MITSMTKSRNHARICIIFYARIEVYIYIYTRSEGLLRCAFAILILIPSQSCILRMNSNRQHKTKPTGQRKALRLKTSTEKNAGKTLQTLQGPTSVRRWHYLDAFMVSKRRQNNDRKFACQWVGWGVEWYGTCKRYASMRLLRTWLVVSRGSLAQN